MSFYFGIEHEIPLIDSEGNFLDYRKLNFNILNKVIQKFPVYQNDYPDLRIGDLGLKVKRLYVEGLEIFDDNGYLIKEYPKGLELRTKFFNDLNQLFKTFLYDFNIVKKELIKFNLKPTFLSFNPYLNKINIKINLNQYEKKLRKQDPGRITAPFTLLTFGPDLNISYKELNDQEILDIVLKLNYYTPFIIPFTFSSPFYMGKLWNGYSVRTYFRSKLRPSAIGFVNSSKLLSKYKNNWILNQNRVGAESGRIEFKAIDTIWDIKIYKSLLILLKGLILDKKLKQKSLNSDIKLMEISAQYGFDDKLIYDGCYETLNSVYNVLGNDDKKYIKYLFYLLKNKINFSKILITEFKKYRSINKVLLKYDKFKI
ncbi:MAG: glutamate--cysteine ligase [Patescibacteria group bacterium]|nr:glutamate--cysteine ligase [Patescibacteria group bacterium]